MEKFQNRHVTIKQGGFYFNVCGNDALLFHKYLGYKLYGIHDYRTGFPVNGMETALTKFDKFHINYDLYSQNGELIISKRFPDNNYEIIDTSQYPLPILTTTTNFYQFILTLQALSEGVHPVTGEIINGIDNELKADILKILLYFEAKLQNKKTFQNAGQSYSANEYGYIEETKPIETPQTTPQSCKNCMEMKNGNCFGRNVICEDFRFSPTISKKEMANWPKYGDVTAFKKGERR